MYFKLKNIDFDLRMKDLLDKKIDDLTYEDAFNRLKDTELLENGNVSLDDSINTMNKEFT